MSAPVLSSKYRLIRRVGVGAMGEVHEAEHVALGKRVAIKRLHPHLARQPDFVARFIREARAAAQIRHPHVVKVFDVEQRDDGDVFIVMELVEGTALDVRLEQLRSQARHLPTGEGIRLMEQLLDGVIAAHDAGVVHRDLKPSNIMLGRDSDGDLLAKILDFGIAKLKTDASLHPLTEPGTILGTPEYMPPEVALGHGEADARGDVFSLAVVLYEVFAGTHPAPGAEPVRVPIIFHRRTYPPLTEAAPWLPHALASAIDQALTPDPAKRFDNMRAFRKAIREALRQSQQSQTADRSLRRIDPTVPAQPFLEPPRPSEPATRERPVSPFRPSPSFGSAAIAVDEDWRRHDSTAPTAADVTRRPRTETTLGWAFLVASAASLVAAALALMVADPRQRLSEEPLTAYVPEVTIPLASTPEPPPPQLWRRPSAQVTGQQGEQRLRLRHTQLRDEADRIHVALTVELGRSDPRPVAIREGRIAFLHYRDHDGPRRAIEAARHPRFDVALPRPGKYHVRGWVTLEPGERLDFDCDLCVEGRRRDCPDMRPICRLR